MGALRNFLRNDHVDINSKYVIFLAIPVNILLRGCKIWALPETLLDSVEVFLTLSILSILGITMRQVKEISITNDFISEKFYHITTIQNQNSIHQLTFVRNCFRHKDTHFPPSFSPFSVITRGNTLESSQQINRW